MFMASDSQCVLVKIIRKQADKSRKQVAVEK